MHLVQIGEQLTVALLAGQVDAVTVYRNFEPYEVRAHGAQTVGFDYEANGVPPFDELIFVARTGAARDSRFVRFLRATEKGLALIRNHPAQGWAMFIAAHPDLDDPLDHSAWSATLPFFAADPCAFNAAQYGHFAQFLQQAGVIDKARPGGMYAEVIGP